MSTTSLPKRPSSATQLSPLPNRPIVNKGSRHGKRPILLAAERPMTPMGSTGSNSTGFEYFHSSLRNVVQRVQGSSLEDKWTKVSDYLEGFFNDTDSTTFEEMAERVLHNITQLTEGLPQPCEPRISVCAMLMDQLVHYYGRLRPHARHLANQVRNEIMKAIFSSTIDLAGTRPLHECRDDPSAVEAHAGRYMVDTWFSQAYHAHQQRQNEGEMNKGVLGEMQNEIDYWKNSYLRKVFMGWRLHVNKEKASSREMSKLKQDYALEQLRVKRLEELQNSYKEQLQILEDTRKELQRLSAKNAELTSELGVMKQEKDYLLRETQRIPELQRQSKELIELKSDMVNMINGLSRERQRYGTLALTLQMFMDRISGSKFECNLRNHLKEKLTAQPTQLLVQWVNETLRLKEGTEGYVVKDLSGGYRLLDTYLTVLHIICPQHLEEDEYLRGITNLDNMFKAQLIHKVMTNIGMPPLITDIEMTQIGNDHQHSMTICQLFQRFCDPTASHLGGMVPLSINQDEERLYDANQSVTKLADMDPLEWKEKLETCVEEIQHWRLMGYNVTLETESQSLDKIRGWERGPASEKEKREMERYTKIKALRIDDLLPKDVGQRTDMLTKMTTVLTQHYLLLRKVYRFYASSDPTIDNVMSVQEFWRFCTDAKIPNAKAGLDRVQLRTLFNQVNRDDEQMKALMDALKDSSLVADIGGERKTRRPSNNPTAVKSRRTSLYNPGGRTDSKAEMIPEEWVEALCRIAQMRYGKSFDTLPNALDNLIRINIKPNCMQLDVDDFRKAIYTTGVQETLDAFKPYLVDIFKAYSREDHAGANGPLEMSFDEWKHLLVETQMLDEVFTHYAAKNIFTKMQDEDEMGVHLMLFHEFLEGIVAVASFKNPAPYLPLHQRLATFCEVDLLPRVEHRFKWPEWRKRKKERAEIAKQGNL